jgi:hypothetical protein
MVPVSSGCSGRRGIYMNGSIAVSGNLIKAMITFENSSREADVPSLAHGSSPLGPDAQVLFDGQA